MSKQILIVEDDEDIRHCLVQLLEDEGYQIRAVEDARDALSYLNNGGNAGLILLDLMLPFMSGAEFVEIIKKDKTSKVSKIPIVITSASGDSARRLGSSVNGYVKKPIDIDVLLRVVSMHFQ